MGEFSPLVLIEARPWRRLTFTTYALSLSFFESVVLDAVVRNGGKDVAILADVDGVRSALGEQGARHSKRSASRRETNRQGFYDADTRARLGLSSIAGRRASRGQCDSN